MKYFISILTFFFICQISFSQIDLGMPISVAKGGVATTIVTDYEAIGVNPSNLGWSKNKTFSAGLLNFGFVSQSKSLSFSNLKSTIINKDEQFSDDLKEQFSNVFVSDNGLNMQTNISWFGVSAQLKGMGGLAVSLRDKAMVHVAANQNFADYAFNGFDADFLKDPANLNKNISELFSGTELNYLHYRELNVSYGVRVFNKSSKEGSGSMSIYGGIGYRYLWGLGIIDIRAQEDGLVAKSALEKSSFDINTSYIDNYTIENTGNIFNSVGSGQAWDFGATLIMNDRFKLGMSVVDIGSIDWDENIIEGSDGKLPTVDSSSIGLNSFDFKEQAGLLFDKDEIINFQEGEPFTTNFPAKLRMGAGIMLTNKYEVGVDMMVPLNEVSGNLENAYFAIGGEVNITSKVKISTGFAGNKSYGYSVPFGFTLGSIGITELYLATNDILTYFNRSDNPIISFSIGVIRFNIK